MQRAIWFGVSLLAISALAESSFAQNSMPRFPRNPANWLNSSPITAETLKGKAALLYFFEEG